MPIKLTLPGWLVSLILGAAAYLRGLFDQRAADQAAATAAAEKADKTVEDAARQVGAMTDDEVKAELSEWQSKS